MDSTWLVLLALGLGLIVGAGFVWMLHVAERRGSHAAQVVSPSVPDGVDQVLDAMESAGVVLDPSNNLIKASPGALAIGLVWNGALVHAYLAELADRVRRTGESVTEECELARGPFGEANIRLSVRVARLGSRYILLLAEDRTESFRLDSVRRDFVANISHELKTPIGAVGLLAEALDEASDDPGQVRRFALRLSEEASRLARITQDIIELSRLQVADALGNAVELSARKVVKAAIDQNKVAAEARRIEIAMRGDKDAMVLGNEPLLVTAVHNLISNAIQYSPGDSRIGIGVRALDGVVEIAVTDQGDGIPEEDLDRVFERFFRVDQARSRNTGGTGLGLSIVKHAVENHGGDVRVWSQPGRGSTFTIRLPEVSAIHPPIGENQ
ncbi:histidine kinase [Leifsonia xyli subsp. xyli]|uniref:Sensor-like histidine kinase SenX3 n=2 Tax=Leifsonia xyli subsp. xyli TaxID=59736 RepID=Q6ADH6_LEIXX|nr:ATP-binding protein [Leifsonia xyli]AAT89570.1 two-component system, sensor protein [Leifsonia xyli subsp. xyli str. CTCB07]ODA91318.1 histidine kinase [Leifsonia xyli subsp. xyli]